MQVLVPIDGSDCSERALRFAAEFCRGLAGELHVVHITDVETEATGQIIDRANNVLAEEGIDSEPSISIDIGLTFRSSNRIGKDILEIVEEEGFDHVIMGHHGAGRVDRLILGSAAETVLQAGVVPVTIVP